MIGCNRWFRLPAGLAAFVLFALAGTAMAQQAWLRTWDGNESGVLHRMDLATLVACDPDGNIFEAGQSQDTLGDWDVAVVKFAPDGDTLWSRRFSQFAGRFDSVVGLTCDDAGNAYITGYSLDSLWNAWMFTIKYLPNGDTAWVRTISSAVGWGVTADAGAVYALGGIWQGSPVTEDIIVIKYDAAGETLWTRSLNGPAAPASNADVPVAIGHDRSGNIIATGKTVNPINLSVDFYTIKLSPAGESLWVRRYDGVDQSSDYPVALTTDESDNVYVCGASDRSSGEGFNYLVVKYSPAGDVLQEYSWNNSQVNGNDLPVAFGLDAGHNVIITGWTWNDYWSTDYFATVKLGPTGELMWAKIFYLTTETSGDYPADLKVDGFGNTYVTGNCEDPDGPVLPTTLKYSPTGDLMWEAYVRDPRSWDDMAFALALDSARNLYLAGMYDNTDPGFDYDYMLVRYSEDDVGVVRILAPTDTIPVNRPVVPAAQVVNHSAHAMTFQVRMEIGDFYRYLTVYGLSAYKDTTVYFGSWASYVPGEFPIVAYTQLAGDKEPRNDTAYGYVVVTTPWVKRESVPGGFKNKTVKDGGSLAFDDGANVIYALKGHNTSEFYAYSNGHWAAMDSIPYQPSRRRIKKGAALAFAAGTVYAAKGSRTAEFWGFNCYTRTWAPGPSLPGVLKQGTGMAYVPGNNQIYVLQGSNTRTLWAYDVNGMTWAVKSPMPAGLKNKNAKGGTALAYDGSSLLYALKGGTNEFYAYDIATDVWLTRSPIPNSQITGKRKKVGEGGALAFAKDRLYAFKGNNTEEFWSYRPALGDTWVEDDSLPKGVSKRRVKSGGALVSAYGKIHALRGNNTLDFYSYNANIHTFEAASQPGEQGGAATGGLRFGLQVTPNPFRSRTSVSYSLPQSGSVSLRLYDVTGRVENELYSGQQPAGIYRLNLNDPTLASGVYFLKIRYNDGSQDQMLTAKVLVQR